ncbi:pleckstrin homology domain-containing family F member 2 [Austrofundulus limnaeus]|uniref:Pleckstrin homology domain-containing family F member 2 n=1 Tax=Austrofundulus limnaeus TaxID=52670 RepID=A0A2I4BYR1_AUSLI|nr:PREDICTED: pleckstrin homology domain-containing family F member 2-like [Austrofundulus limnaeus]
MDLLLTEDENRKRIRKVENSFGPSGMPLSIPGRVLIGEGKLRKQGRKKQELKAFFLFNDVLVYGSVIMNGRWYKKQKVIPLEDVEIEDLENSESMQHQWLISTPRKSFFVSATTGLEKQAWMEHIRDCRSRVLEDKDVKPSANYAMSWIPDKAAQKCMRCLKKFSYINRKHHCRKCGFVVCNECSRKREFIKYINSNHEVRICKVCYEIDEDDKDKDSSRQRGDSSGMHSSKEEEEEEEGAMSSDEEQIQTSSSWLDTKTGTWGRLSAICS